MTKPSINLDSQYTFCLKDFELCIDSLWVINLYIFEDTSSFVKVDDYIVNLKDICNMHFLHGYHIVSDQLNSCFEIEIDFSYHDASQIIDALSIFEHLIRDTF